MNYERITYYLCWTWVWLFLLACLALLGFCLYSAPLVFGSALSIFLFVLSMQYISSYKKRRP